MSNNWKLCRACLTAEETFTYMIFETVSAEIFNYCTSVEISEDEDLPKALCNSCHELLMKFSKFKEMCIQSQNTLMELKFKTIVKNELESSLSSLIENRPEQNLMKVVKEEDLSDHFNDDLLEESDFPVHEPVKKVKVKKRKGKKLERKKHIVKLVRRGPFNFTCELCNKKFNYLERFEAHKMEHEGKTVPINCLPCGKTFTTWNGLKRHNRNEHTLVNLESLKCTLCGKIYKSQDTLKMHQKAHSQKMMYVCEVCGKDFSTKFVLKSHLETHKENRERQYTCKHCGKQFFTNALLSNHVSRRHTGRRFICQICNYPFRQKYNLAKHLLIHEGRKLHECDICHKSYATHFFLVEHKRIHSGERPFSCSFCSKSFLSKRRLNDHHKTHTGERPHKCGVCELGFTQRGTMKRHMKVHERAVPAIN